MKLPAPISAIFLAAFASALLSAGAQAEENRLEVLVDDVFVNESELVDDFSGTTINFERWTSPPHEYAAKVDPVAENLVLISAGNAAPIPFNITQLPLADPDVLSIEATMTLVSTAITAGGEISANISGQFFNASRAAPTDQTGEIIATLSIGDRNAGFLEAWGTILASTHPDFATWVEFTYDITLPAPLALNTPYQARIEYNRALNQFTFFIDATSQIATAPDYRFAAFAPRQFVSVTSCCDDDVAIHATVDNVEVSGTLVEDFSAGFLERETWNSPSGAVTLSSRLGSLDPGKLLLFTSSEDIPENGDTNAEIVLGGENPDRIEALVAISSESDLPRDIRGRTRLNGYAYNEKRDGGDTAMRYDECDDEVWVQVEIIYENNDLWAVAESQVEDRDCEPKRTLIEEQFTQSIRFDTDYLLWIELDGNTLTLGLDDESFSHTIDTDIYAPNQKFRRLSAGIEEGPGQDLEDGDDDDDCFIATAAYGSYLHPRVKTLRDFRDNHLLTNRVGQQMVAFYYRHSPPIADYIRERDTLRSAVRVVLAGVIYSIEHPLAAMLLLVGMIALARRVVLNRKIRAAA